jgi:hypothetical protein
MFEHIPICSESDNTENFIWWRTYVSTLWRDSVGNHQLEIPWLFTKVKREIMVNIPELFHAYIFNLF